MKDSYCDNTTENPVITSETFYQSYRRNGSKWAGVPQCHTCATSNSYGKYGCPRLNAGLPIGVGEIVGVVKEWMIW